MNKWEKSKTEQSSNGLGSGWLGFYTEPEGENRGGGEEWTGEVCGERGGVKKKTINVSAWSKDTHWFTQKLMHEYHTHTSTNFPLHSALQVVSGFMNVTTQALNVDSSRVTRIKVLFPLISISYLSLWLDCWPTWSSYMKSIDCCSTWISAA